MDKELERALKAVEGKSSDNDADWVLISQAVSYRAVGKFGGDLGAAMRDIGGERLPRLAQKRQNLANNVIRWVRRGMFNEN